MDAKDYLARNNIPQLFECLLTGLMYHRPKDYIEYLQDGLKKIEKQGVKSVRWDLFLEAKRQKSALPPIPHTNGLSREATQFLEEAAGEARAEEQRRATPLPKIASNEERDVSRVEQKFVLALGGPGSGKGTVCHMTQTCLAGWVHISIGDLLRQYTMQQPDGKWQMALNMISKGDMVPQEATMDILLSEIGKHQDAIGFIVEGFPRSISQLEEWNKHIGKIDLVILIDCEEESLQDRLLRRGHEAGRADDNPVAVARRIAYFKANTLSVCKYFDDLERLHVLEGERDVIEISREVLVLLQSQLAATVTAELVAPQPPATPKPEHTRPHPRPTAAPAGPAANQTAEDADEGLGQEEEEGADEQQPALLDIRRPEVSVPDDGVRRPGLPTCPILLLLGGPGSGRSVQAERLCATYAAAEGEGDGGGDGGRFHHVNIGGELRRTALSDGNAEKAWDTMAALITEGDVNPEDVTVDIVVEALKNVDANAKAIILEGYPLNEAQLNEVNEKIGCIDLAVLIDCDEYYMQMRLLDRGRQTGRMDDNLKAIGRRLAFFKQHTLPVVRYYDEEGKLVVIAGDRDQDEIFYDLTRLIDYAFFKQDHNHSEEHIDIESIASERIVRGDETMASPRGDTGDMKNGHVSSPPSGDQSVATPIVEQREDTGVEMVVEPLIEPQVDTSTTGYLDGTVPNRLQEIGNELLEELPNVDLTETMEACKDAKVVFVLGGPGCGKGTQCEKLVETYGFTHLSSGDLLRAEVESGSEKGNELKAIMERGELVSLDIILELIRKAVLKGIKEGKVQFLLDGFPRKVDQAERFEKEVVPCQFCVYFELHEDVMVQRLMKRGETSGRVDDNEETIKKRLATFQNETMPLIEYFQASNKLIKIDASHDIDHVFTSVKQEIDARKSS